MLKTSAPTRAAVSDRASVTYRRSEGHQCQKHTNVTMASWKIVLQTAQSIIQPVATVFIQTGVDANRYANKPGPLPTIDRLIIYSSQV